MKKQSTNIIFFGLMQGFYWGTCASFNVFLVFYLESLGIPSSHIGLLLTVGMIAGVTSQYFWGYLCDYLNGIKKVMALCIIGAVAAVWTLPTVQGIKAIFPVYIAFMLFQPVIPSLIDTWTIQLNKSTRKNYSKLRSLGSLTFAVMSSFFGLLVEKYFFNAMSIAFTLFSILLFTTVILSEDLVKEKRIIIKETKYKESPLSLLKNIKFIVFLFGIMLIFIPNSFISSYMFYIARSVNGSAREMGITFGLAAILEIPIFIMFGRITKKVSVEKLLVIGSVFLVARIFQLIFIKTPYGLYTNALFHGIGFPIIISSFRHYVPSIVPKHLIVTGQAITGAFAGGIPYIMATYFGGNIIQRYGITHCYMLFSLLASIAFIPFVYLNLTSLKNKNKIPASQFNG